MSYIFNEDYSIKLIAGNRPTFLTRGIHTFLIHSVLIDDEHVKVYKLTDSPVFHLELKGKWLSGKSKIFHLSKKSFYYARTEKDIQKKVKSLRYAENN
jgi:hypothetical protein